MEVISPEGLRQDGRTALCLRDISCRLGLYERPNGSAYIEMGNTKVLAAVYGPREVLSRHIYYSMHCITEILFRGCLTCISGPYCII
ncbi:Exosome complex component RRP41 [Portunus trituberculatus]|uniref:Exosome complex component RRP41 n=1 Tax=Portunus trituberculatus TaxID=210409 RepID=A0A5B7HCB7_PORTR|nr:Exosome complex component RRP41 [Portunus trituberculatus]